MLSERSTDTNSKVLGPSRIISVAITSVTPMEPSTQVQRPTLTSLVESYKRTFGVTPKGFSSPLGKNDHPELDSLEELGTGEITLFQSHIGCLQWCVTLGRFDIATAVMAMSRYRVSPRKGHLEQTKQMIGYLRKFKLGSVRVRTGIPDYSYLGKSPEYDWMNSVYGDVLEEVPKDAPAPLGKTVMTTTYVDANLYHNLPLDVPSRVLFIS